MEIFGLLVGNDYLCTNEPTNEDSNGRAPTVVAVEIQNIQNISATKVGNFPQKSNKPTN